MKLLKRKNVETTGLCDSLVQSERIWSRSSQPRLFLLFARSPPSPLSPLETCRHRECLANTPCSARLLDVSPLLFFPFPPLSFYGLTLTC